MYCAMQHLDTPGYDAALFMESAEKLRMPGGLLDRSKKLYAPLSPQGLDALNLTDKRWRFQLSGRRGESSIALSYVGDPGRWDGLEVAFIGIDQVEQVSQEIESAEPTPLQFPVILGPLRRKLNHQQAGSM